MLFSLYFFFVYDFNFSIESCRLVLFGSSVNGFGFSGSDMDICLQFSDQPEVPHDVDPIDVVKRVSYPKLFFNVSITDRIILPG